MKLSHLFPLICVFCPLLFVYVERDKCSNPERVKSSIEKLEKAHAANRKPQARMDSFFAVKANPAADAKRKKRLEEGKAKKKQKATEDRKKKGKGKK